MKDKPDGSSLVDAVKAVRLYAPGRLLHLQHLRDRATAQGERAATGAQREQGSENGSGHDAFVLVDGEAEARFEFIAVRSTWIADHSLENILSALAKSEQP